MAKTYCLYVGNLEELMSDATSALLQEIWLKKKQTCLMMDLNKNFDAWDIELYVERFNNLCIDELKIRIEKEPRLQPTYKQILEVQEALKHFATYDGYDEVENVQRFHNDEMKIFFYHAPVN